MSKKLHLGCGSVYKDGWINIDLYSPIADLLQDLTAPLPYEDATVDFIYSEHFIEHITHAQAVIFLQECRRVLRDSGVLRISTPDLKFLVKCYRNKDISQWGALWGPDSPCNLMNEGMRSWGHQYIYDQSELTRILREAGYKSISRMKWGASEVAQLQGMETREYHGDLIIEARGRSEDSVGFFARWAWW